MPARLRAGTFGSTMGTPAAAAPLRTALAAPRQLAVDVALALGALAITLVTLGQDDGPIGAGAVVLAVVSALPLIARRRAPLLAFTVMAVASAAINLLGYELSIGVGATIMLWFLALERPGRRPWLTAFAVVGLFLAQVAADLEDGTWSPLPIPLVIWLVVWRAGELVRERRERMAALEERVASAEREAERERDLAVARERTRIARDLHDSAGHAINVILVQAGAARLLSERDPAGARAALQAIEHVARDTIGEIDRLVSALRDDEAPAVPRGLAALGGLADGHRATGLDVRVEMRGRPHALPAGTDQAAYGIAREALTNAARHGTGTVTLEVEHADDGVRLVVANPTPPGWTAAPDGHGIVGMRERAALVGGRLTAGGAGGAFRVEADLPAGPERP
jgi:signal transduction histidine kinase